MTRPVGQATWLGARGRRQSSSCLTTLPSVAGQLVDEPDLAGPLVRGEQVLGVGEQVGLVERGCARYDDRGDHLAPFRRGRADHGDLGDPRVPGQDLFDLAGVDVEATADDELLAPPDDPQITVRVELTEVAGAEPPAVERGLGRGWVAPSTWSDHVRPAHEDLAPIALVELYLLPGAAARRCPAGARRRRGWRRSSASRSAP